MEKSNWEVFDRELKITRCQEIWGEVRYKTAVLFSLGMEKILIEEVENCEDIEGLKRVVEVLKKEKHGFLWKHAIGHLIRRIQELENDM